MALITYRGAANIFTHYRHHVCMHMQSEFVFIVHIVSLFFNPIEMFRLLPSCSNPISFFTLSHSLYMPDD